MLQVFRSKVSAERGVVVRRAWPRGRGCSDAQRAWPPDQVEVPKASTRVKTLVFSCIGSSRLCCGSQHLLKTTPCEGRHPCCQIQIMVCAACYCIRSMSEQRPPAHLKPNFPLQGLGSCKLTFDMVLAAVETSSLYAAPSFRATLET